MTLEEAQAKIAELEGQLTQAQADGEVSAKRGHAFAAVLKAHNIAFDIDKADVSTLTIADGGEVQGEFDYTPPAVKATERHKSQQPGNQQQRNEGEGANKKKDGLTIEDVKAMSEDQINDQWEEVSKVLAKEGETNGNK